MAWLWLGINGWSSLGLKEYGSWNIDSYNHLKVRIYDPQNWRYCRIQYYCCSSLGMLLKCCYEESTVQKFPLIHYSCRLMLECNHISLKKKIILARYNPPHSNVRLVFKIPKNVSNNITCVCSIKVKSLLKFEICLLVHHFIELFKIFESTLF